MVVESSNNTNNEDELYEDQSLLEREVRYIPANNDQWYYEMKYYLTHGTTLKYLEPKNKRTLKPKSVQHHLSQGIMFRKNYDGIFLICLEKDDAKNLLSELHDRPVRGYFGGDTIAQKNLRGLLMAHHI